MVVYAYNSELRRLRQEDCEFKVSLSYIARLHLKKKKISQVIRVEWS
jgi:hypothetical protein